MRGRWLLPMHHSTFRLSHEPLEEPMQRMLAAAGSESDRVIIRSVGEQWTAPE
jgi:L-ascorbate metabolism protein UlaG (beta-lactamase superfamily)